MFYMVCNAAFFACTVPSKLFLDIYSVSLGYPEITFSKVGIAGTFLKFQATDYMKQVAFLYRSSVILQKRKGENERRTRLFS